MKLKRIIAAIAALCIALAAATFTACEEKTDGLCEHNIVAVAQHDASCTETGNFAHYKCTQCGELFSDIEGTTLTTADRITIAKLPHNLQQQNETVGKYKNFYACSSCGGYFSDKDGKKEIPYSELEDGSVTPIKLAELSNYGNLLVTKTVNAESDFEDISGDFTLRMFVGWTGSNGETVAELPPSSKLQTNYNLNRLCTLQPSSGDVWYNFGVGYSKSGGLFYKRLQSGNETAPSEFNALFVQNNGIYVRVVRKGNTVSFYFEDKFGKPRLIDSNSGFGSPDGTLIRIAANKAEGAEGWTPFVKNAEICLGVANARCVFSK